MTHILSRRSNTDESVIRDALFDGRDAFKAGLVGCPHPPGTIEARYWKLGWTQERDRQKEEGS